MNVGKLGSYTVCGPGTDPWIRVKKLLDSERLPNISVQGGRGSVNKQGEFNSKHVMIIMETLFVYLNVQL